MYNALNKLAKFAEAAKGTLRVEGRERSSLEDTYTLRLRLSIDGTLEWTCNESSTDRPQWFADPESAVDAMIQARLSGLQDYAARCRKVAEGERQQAERYQAFVDRVKEEIQP